MTELEREDNSALANALDKIPKTVEKLAERVMIAKQHLNGVNLSRQVALMDAAADRGVTMISELRTKLHLKRIEVLNDQLQEKSPGRVRKKEKSLRGENGGGVTPHDGPKSTSPTQTQTLLNIMKSTLLLLAASMLTTGVSCSSMGTDSGGRRYYHSAAPIQSKTGLTYKETRAVAHKPAVSQEGYSHSAAPIASKTGLQVGYSR